MHIFNCYNNYYRVIGEYIHHIKMKTLQIRDEYYLTTALLQGQSLLLVEYSYIIF